MPDEFSLIMPVLRLPEGTGGTLLVDETSPVRMRRYVEQIGRHFKRELRTDAPPYLASEVPGNLDYIPYHAHLFLEDARDRLVEGKPMPYRVVGVAMFRYQMWTNAPAGWEFSWVWLHPFSRRRGHLSKAWPDFRMRYEDFAVSQVLSLGMQAFLSQRRADA